MLDELEHVGSCEQSGVNLVYLHNMIMRLYMCYVCTSSSVLYVVSISLSVVITVWSDTMAGCDDVS